MRIRAILGVALSLVAAGCTGDTDTERVGQLILQSFTGAAAPGVSRNDAAAIPYPSMGMQWGDSGQALLVLGATRQPELDWYAGDSVLVVTRQGRVVRTVGLPNDLGGQQLREGPSATGATLFSADFPDLNAFNVLIRCESADKGPEAIEIFGAAIATHHLVEHCQADSLGWNFDNEFWKDDSGYVWQSVQYTHPQGEALRLTVFRPEATAQTPP